MKIDIKKLPKSLVEITGEIPKEKLEEKRKDAIKNLAGKVEIDGFRKGMAPESVLVKKLGSMSILEEMAQICLNEAYPEIILKHELDVIGYPEISITKIAEGNPLGFKITSTIVPEIELPNYKKIAGDIVSKKENIEITDKEVGETIEEIRKQRATKRDLGDGKTKEILQELND